ncbi:hypothetical protein [Krasilnikovia sp. M28-CT-15]|uniref:hypothetical protein n=1 Tax=Krasilnikovia sp. M28-CT-15 TaxID=3373540 RepID=UPI00399D11AD
MTGRARKLMIGAAAATLVGGAFAISTGISSAGENCGGLDQALQNNLNFIAGQKANPDAQSDARIANRQAVVDLIQQRRAAAGCTANVAANNGNAGQGNNGNAGNGNNGQGKGSGEDCGGLDKALQNNLNFIAGQKANPDAQSAARIANRQAVVDLINQRRAAAGCTGNAGQGNNGNAGQGNNGNAGQGNNGNAGQGNNGNAGQGNNGNAGQGNNGNAGQGNNGNAGQGNNGNAGQGNNGNAGQGNNGNGTGAGEVVCKGSTVTTTGSGGKTALSGNFPPGTQLKVTNLDNNKSIVVPVESAAGSCILLNKEAFDSIHEEGKLLIRRAVIERVG